MFNYGIILVRVMTSPEIVRPDKELVNLKPSSLTTEFDPIDRVQWRLLAQLPPASRVRVMLEARELAVGLMRGRLRRRYPDLSTTDLNLKLLEELSDAGQGPA
jgi:hypothetical protein